MLSKSLAIVWKFLDNLSRTENPSFLINPDGRLGMATSYGQILLEYSTCLEQKYFWLDIGAPREDLFTGLTPTVVPVGADKVKRDKDIFMKRY
jgi:hypothetical protein